ncbi:MAG: AAA family ATPase [Phycisphaeraceae bacterium]
MNTADSLAQDDRDRLKRAAGAAEALQQQIARRIVGQEPVVRALLAATFAQGHTLLIGVPGLAKTLLVKTLAEVLGWRFRRIQFTPDMMPADIIGMELLHEDAAAGERCMRFVPGPIFANLILADEINRTPPKTQSALLEAMQEYQVTSMGHRHELDPPFVVIATQNPIEQEGTYPLPEAQLDRFMFSLWMDYPPVEEEERVVAETTVPQNVTIEPVLDKAQMLEHQELVRRIPATPHAVSYAVAIARATRPNSVAASEQARQYVEWGAGTRAAQHMILAGKALALIDGQPAVSAAHIREAARHVLRHRVLPNYQAAAEGIESIHIIDRVLEEIHEPSYTG